ncbi:hypothetical protein BCR33DRAFT_559797 [Rhizoclosmatium globosum]|uniref:Uncharacterized protein n=1 Tax=Rhizoclosmatium globosum TaxID=329046 RepID=A0A1Y2CSZ5_9FUNG|nr:hypothetical protein BCR33DRAFT_559797 [Rhizoclosmatium globosum]|eukprot:ORY50016.1 hypothetical protein BCR33DRAFT_559797 [Rhizoclosmatium globosum]
MSSVISKTREALNKKSTVTMKPNPSVSSGSTPPPGSPGSSGPATQDSQLASATDPLTVEAPICLQGVHSNLLLRVWDRVYGLQEHKESRQEEHDFHFHGSVWDGGVDLLLDVFACRDGVRGSEWYPVDALKFIGYGLELLMLLTSPDKSPTLIKLARTLLFLWHTVQCSLVS